LIKKVFAIKSSNKKVNPMAKLNNHIQQQKIFLGKDSWIVNTDTLYKLSHLVTYKVNKPRNVSTYINKNISKDEYAIYKILSTKKNIDGLYYILCDNGDLYVMATDYYRPKIHNSKILNKYDNIKKIVSNKSSIILMSFDREQTRKMNYDFFTKSIIALTTDQKLVNIDHKKSTVLYSDVVDAKYFKGELIILKTDRNLYKGNKKIADNVKLFDINRDYEDKNYKIIILTYNNELIVNHENKNHILTYKNLIPKEIVNIKCNGNMSLYFLKNRKLFVTIRLLHPKSSPYDNKKKFIQHYIQMQNIIDYYPSCATDFIIIDINGDCYDFDYYGTNKFKRIRLKLEHRECVVCLGETKLHKNCCEIICTDCVKLYPKCFMCKKN